MGDHLDFSNSTFNKPFVGKSVTQVTQTVTTVARPDDKVYVVMKSEFYGRGSGENTFPIGVAMSVEQANTFVRTYKVAGGKLTAHEQGTDGLWYRHFDLPEMPDSVEMVAIYVEVTDVI